MNYNLKRHKILKILTSQNLKVQLNENEKIPLGISYNDIYKKLNITSLDLIMITSELYENKEIDYHNAYGVEGICCNNLGITAFSNKKYKKAYRSEIISLAKDITQIIIPILALIIAILTLTNKIENYDSKYKTEIYLLKTSIKKLETDQKKVLHNNH